MYNKNNLRDVMKAKKKHFWKIPYENKYLSNRIGNIYKGINFLQLAMLVDIIVIMEFCCLGPYYNSSNPFIFASKTFVDAAVLDVVVLFSQYYVVALVTFIVYGYDCMYLSLCTELRVQVKLLKYKLKEVFTKTGEGAAFGVSICVKQHNFLLS